ncbi:DUF3084 domain-containing protein [Vulcanococcus limneticus Candia 3F8]|uniref:DUF3084 domain-containing protein n=1 Tax=Vulcanococcus limneticus TaxID=2170428 RepID=UPI000B99557E|nr:DUF3084 domain-containing protein [Vulcanococcus limneticus]MCP9791754.1 DUF3084 domain-containing protein [Vulcanococcus limneticus MW73D5]MCP9893562.1 DUF3084 domain-containing protein [Vulcanococcus limneticus Candia 3F8]MCP9897095.1 DUF3084 domain-containing protein [Vulcanococcus limneticus Candia 3B3]
MSGWLLILALLVLGGALSTLGDRLGTRVGKARLSLFQLRPRKTAVLITVLTGSLISALSLGLMLLVSERLRVGLFQLDQIEHRLRKSRQALGRSQEELQRSQAELATSRQELRSAESGRRQAQVRLGQAERRAQALRSELQPLVRQRAALEQERDRLSKDISAKDADIRRNRAELEKVTQRIAAGAKELKQLETNLIALRRGDVVISSGQTLATAKINLQKASQAREVIEALLRQANLAAYQRVLPGEQPNRQILLVPRGDIAKLEEIISRRGSWVVSLVSAANVLKGERQVLAFPDVRPNRQVIRRGEQMATTVLEGEETGPEAVRSRLNLLLAAAFTKAQRQGSLADGLQFDVGSFNRLGLELSNRPAGQQVRLEAVAGRDSDIADPVVVELRWSNGPAGSSAGPMPSRSRP